MIFRQFSGKWGIWPFIVKEPALRNSKNRSAGTMVTKTISVDKEAYRAALIDKIIPSIKKSWPEQRKAIYIQQDNAKPHVRPDDPDIVAAGTDGGWNIHLQCQPPNSPDFNVLDLGFFNSIQSLQHQKSPKTIDELIDCVTESFNELMPNTLNSVYLTLQSVLRESLKADGGNHFKIPHMKMEKLSETGDLPLSINCNASVFERALEFSNIE